MRDIGNLSYPEFSVPHFLPTLDLSCVQISGEAFLSPANDESETLSILEFLEAIREECDFVSEAGGLSGGYDTDTEELSLNIAIELEASTTVRQAIWKVMDIMGEQLSLDDEFYSDLAGLDAVVLTGGVVAHFTIGASIDPDLISEGNYGDAKPFVRFTRFEATASLSANEISLNFPVLLPVPGAPSVDVAQFRLDDGSLAVVFSIHLLRDEGQIPVGVEDLFAAVEYSGTLNASLPVSVEVGGNGDSSFGLTVQLYADDLFTTPRPEVSYEVDTCSIRETVLTLFGQLRERLLEAVVEFLVTQVNSVSPIEVDMIVEPLNFYVSNMVSNFTDTYIEQYLPSCSETNNPDEARYLEEEGNADDESLASVIRRAISATNAALEDSGIHVTGESEPFFDGDLFVAGISTSLGAVIDLNLAEVATFIQTFFADVTDPDSSSDISALGIGSGVGVSIDLEQLLNDMVIQAGFDLSFDITMDLGRMQASGLDDLGTALLEGFVLTFNRWGAFASFTADPINVGFTAGTVNVSVTDSSFQVGVELESQGAFSASVKDMVDGRQDLNASNLEPTVDIPLNIEVMFNIEVAGFTLSPILLLTTNNILGSETLDFGFDCNLDLFLSGSPATATDGIVGGGQRHLKEQSFGSDINLDTVFRDLTDLLGVVAEFGPEFQDAPSAVQGLFSVINQTKDFANGLVEFRHFVQRVDELIPRDIRSVISHASELGRNGCVQLPNTFQNYTFELLGLDIPRDAFDACKHLPEIQKALNFTAELLPSENVTLASLVIIPSDIGDRLKSLFGFEFNGEVLLDTLKAPTLMRLLDYLGALLPVPDLPADEDEEDMERRLEVSPNPLTRAPNQLQMRRRARAMRAVRESMRHENEFLIFSYAKNRVIKVNDFLAINFGFNFGDGDRQLYLGAHFAFDTDDG